VASVGNPYHNTSRSVCTSTIVVPPDLLSPSPSGSSAVKTADNSGEDLDDPELAGEGDIRMVHCSD